MPMRTKLISALILAISCVSVQANIDTWLTAHSKTAGEPVLLLAQSNEQDRLDDFRDRRDDLEDDLEDDLRDRRDDLDCEDDKDDCYDDCDDDDDDCYGVCDDNYDCD